MQMPVYGTFRSIIALPIARTLCLPLLMKAVIFRQVVRMASVVVFFIIRPYYTG